MKRSCFVVTAALLAGCGGGDRGAAAPMPVAEPAPATAGDAFTATLAALVGAASDAAEPAEVDGTAPAAPDHGEPLAVE